MSDSGPTDRGADDSQRRRPAPAEEESLEYELEERCEPDSPLRQEIEPADAPSYDAINETWQAHFTAESGRFTLLEMMLALTAATVALALVKFLPPSLGAALLGVAVVIGLIALISTACSRLFHLMWWMLLLLYVTLAVVAVAQR